MSDTNGQSWIGEALQRIWQSKAAIKAAAERMEEEFRGQQAMLRATYKLLDETEKKLANLEPRKESQNGRTQAGETAKRLEKPGAAPAKAK